MVKVYRVDDRLIHGQVQTSWIKKYSINRIIIIDDGVCNDEITKRILKVAKPAQTDLVICGTDRAVSLLEKDAAQQKARTLVIFKTIKTASEIVKQGWKVEELIIGPTSNKESTVQVAKNTYFTQCEIDALRYLVETGTNVVSQLLPSEPRVSLASKINDK